jgi:hypothetical protein
MNLVLGSSILKGTAGVAGAFFFPPATVRSRRDQPRRPSGEQKSLAVILTYLELI